MDGKWLTRAQAAECLGTGTGTVHKLCTQGLLEQRPPGSDVPGLCGCGCGNPAPIARWSDATRGRVGGQPIKFIHGHNNRTFVSAASVARMKAIRDARRAVTAAQRQLAVLAASGDRTGLLAATAELAQRKADLLVAEMGDDDG